MVRYIIHLPFSYTRFDCTSDHCLLTQSLYTSYTCSFLIGGFEIHHFIPLNNFNKIHNSQPVQPTLALFKSYPLQFSLLPALPVSRGPTPRLHLDFIWRAFQYHFTPISLSSKNFFKFTLNSSSFHFNFISISKTLLLSLLRPLSLYLVSINEDAKPLNLSLPDLVSFFRFTLRHSHFSDQIAD